MKQTITTICCLLLFAGLTFAQDASLADFFKEKTTGMLNVQDRNAAWNARQDWQKRCFELGAPGQETGKAEAVKLMSDALGKPENAPAYQWLIRQVGRLGDGSSVATLGPFLDSDDRLVRDEALWAIANISSAESVKFLTDKLAKESDAAKKAALQQALTFLEKRKPVTLPTFAEILAALAGTDEVAWDQALPSLAWLDEPAISTVPNAKATFEKLSPRAQVLLIDALTVKRDRTALPFALLMSASDDDAVRLAGYRAMGPLGNASTLPLLVEKIREQGDLGNTVRDSLCRLNFDGCDEALIALAEKETDNGIKNELFEVLRRRGGTIAVDAFLAGMKSTDDGIRGRSVYALESIAEDSAVPTLVGCLLAEKNNGIRDAIERALVRINERYTDADGRGETLCAEIKKRDATEQIALLPVLGKIGGAAAEKLLIGMLSDTDVTLREAAFRAVCNWPDVTIADELYKLATGANEAWVRPATRAYIRVITLNSDRNGKDALALFKKAYEICKTDEDRNLLIARCQSGRSVEVFAFAVGFLDNPELAQAACRAIADMTNDTGFHMRNREMIEPVLDRVIDISTDEQTIERAKRFKARP